MTTMKPMNLNEINESDMTFSKVNNLDNGGKICFVNYGEDGSSIHTSTGLMELPWDMNVYEEPNGEKSYGLSLSFKNRDVNQVTKNFFEGCEKLDEIMLDKGVEHQLEWLKKNKKTKEHMKEDYFTPNIRWAKDKETGELNTQYPPRFQVKLAKRNGRWTFDAYDQNRAKIDLDEVNLEDLLVKGAKVKALLKLTTVWTGARGYGCKWAVVQLKIHKSQQLIGYAFDDDDEDDETEYSQNKGPSLTPAADDNLSQEDEDEEDYLEEAVDAPKPEPKKKKIVRKKKSSA